MNALELLKLFEKAKKRAYLFGNERFGVIIGLDLEGRLFYVYNGVVISKVNPDSIAGFSDASGYKNPGGDGLWPAPEGSLLGYEYSTGSWQVPSSIVNSRFMITSETACQITIEAEVPLINSMQVGIPTLFRRTISLGHLEDKMSIEVIEEIEYVGAKSLKQGECSLAPWSLSQFEWKNGDYLSFRTRDFEAIRDLYSDSSAFRGLGSDGEVIYKPTEEKRYQIAMGEEVDSIALHLVDAGLKVERFVEKIDGSGDYIDIADIAPDIMPKLCGVKFSFYSDPSHFMEIEGAGGGALELVPNQILRIKITTTVEKE